ncbi:MAG: hypothetical protein COB20_13810 [SAR86 cluster bacterium]|uniref:Chemotaxis protein n=1 Tax=SAR86 cluster bacterium TaxID=2030880 RepID=A0A2A4WXN9_9GAMM|nr:MAG: hypothetical protein COB20_13810 [SAR86 cluster bacterium]
MGRNIRRSIDVGLTGLGIGVIFTAVLLSSSLTIQMQLPIALVGVLLMEAGVWGLASKIFPSERRYIDLRKEGDYIIQLIRQLNAAAVARERGADVDGRFQATLDEMHDSIKRMAELASRESGPQATSA